MTVRFFSKWSAFSLFWSVDYLIPSECVLSALAKQWRLNDNGLLGRAAVSSRPNPFRRSRPNFVSTGGVMVYQYIRKKIYVTQNTQSFIFPNTPKIKGDVAYQETIMSVLYIQKILVVSKTNDVPNNKASASRYRILIYKTAVYSIRKNPYRP